MLITGVNQSFLIKETVQNQTPLPLQKILTYA